MSRARTGIPFVLPASARKDPCSLQNKNRVDPVFAAHRVPFPSWRRVVPTISALQRRLRPGGTLLLSGETQAESPQPQLGLSVACDSREGVGDSTVPGAWDVHMPTRCLSPLLFP